LSYRSVFLDRDGVLIEEREYLSRPEDVVLLPGAAHAVLRLCSLDLKIVIITNQSGIGRAFFLNPTIMES